MADQQKKEQPVISFWWSVATSFLLLLTAGVGHTQELPAPQGAQADTLSFYGMQMFVSVVSSERLALRFDDSGGQNLLEQWGYQQSGEFYFRQWPDPITEDPLYRIIGFSVDPAAVNMEGTNLDDGGILRVSCTPDGGHKIAVMIDGYLDGGSDGNLEGIFRFDDQEPQESGNWSLVSNWDGAIVPERQWNSFWQGMASRDTLAVRFNDDSQDQYTYLFSLNGLSEAVNETGVCGR